MARPLATTGTATPWWLVLMEGVASLVLGLLLVTSPGMTLFVMVQVLGIFWLVGGVLRITNIFLDKALWGWKLFAGLLGIAAGIIVLRHPLWSTVLVPAAIVLVTGIQGVLIGSITLMLAFYGAGWGTAILGALSVLFGVILIANPLMGAAVLPFVLGTFAIVGGIASIVLAFRLRETEEPHTVNGSS
jgi:uncharacterized membrane protein HdeD (DUF308 family)